MGWRQRFWARAPRQLKVTRSGKILLGIALAAGFAAINTGNNLLFLGWGMVLSGIVLSGVLSEGFLQAVRPTPWVPKLARVGERTALRLDVVNPRISIPALGVDFEMHFTHSDAKESADEVFTARAPTQFVLRLGPKERVVLYGDFQPTVRGAHDLMYVEARTTLPFGFFAKSRRFAPTYQQRVWVAPRRLNVEQALFRLAASTGEEEIRRRGPGFDFFSLRSYQEGDDPRRVHWRRSATTGRLVVIETEEHTSRAVLLCLAWNDAAAKVGVSSPMGQLREYALAALGSLAESLAEQEIPVGVCTHGVYLVPNVGRGQRDTVLQALARLDPESPVPIPRLGASVVVVQLQPAEEIRSDVPWRASTYVDISDLQRDQGEATA